MRNYPGGTHCLVGALCVDYCQPQGMEIHPAVAALLAEHTAAAIVYSCECRPGSK